jgi:hypothetical protein
MPCSAGRELKQMLANAIIELTAASEAMFDEAVPLHQRERRLRHAKENHTWTSTTLLEHVGRCSACRERESAFRPAYRETLLNPKLHH